jgi:hypothetical protein
MPLSIEPASNSKTERFEQPEKHASPILVVTLGRVNDFSAEQQPNARGTNVSKEHRGRKRTCERAEQPRKTSSSSKITDCGIEID